MAKKKINHKEMEPLDAIKRLLILGLIKSGVQGKDIAVVLGVDPATITRIVPARKVNKQNRHDNRKR